MSTLKQIAVIGLSCRFPGAANAAEFWENLKNGVESISHFSREDLLKSGVDPVLIDDRNYVNAGFTIEGEDLFDAAFFGYSSAEAEITDPQQRIFLETVWKALEDGGYTPDQYEGDIGIFAGCRISTYLMNMKASLPLFGNSLGLQMLIGNDKDYLTSRISYKLNIRGPSVTVQSACSTSLVAIHMACESLLSGECDMALAGGVAVSIPQKIGYLYQKGMIFSKDGRCRAFDSAAQGIAPGNGSGAVLLKRLEDALADGDHIYAQILGSAVNNDGALKVGYTAPGVSGQSDVIEEALSVSEVKPDSISYIETHGTGTELGDPVEVEALSRVFTKNSPKEKFCALGSVKTNIGHLDSAAGIASFIKTVLALKEKTLPPSLNYEKPNPNINFEDSPFYVNATLAPWEKNDGPRRAGVSSFGFGGTNAHVILEEAPSRRLPHGEERSRSFYILPISAKNSKGLKRLSRRYKEYIENNKTESLKDICFTAACGRSHFPYRLAVIADSHQSFISQLDRFVENSEHGDRKMGFHAHQKIAFFFPGKRPQYSGMGRLLYETQPVFRTTVDRCSHILEKYFSQPLLSFIYTDDGEKEFQNETALIQPALFALEYALAQMWKSWGIKPDLVMGHSVGEYTAACIAGCFSLEDGLFMISQRTRLMQDSQLIEPMVEAYRQVLNEICFHEPKVPLISNITGKVLPNTELPGSDYWGRHVLSPAPLLSDVTAAQNESDTLFIEIAPQPLLTNLECLDDPRDKDAWLATTPEKSSDNMEQSLKALSILYMSGFQVHWKGVFPDSHFQRVSLPGYPFDRKRFWIPENLAKNSNTYSGRVEREAETKNPSPESAFRFYKTSWMEKSSALPSFQTNSGVWIILEDKTGIGEGLKKEIAASGDSCFTISFSLPNGNEMDTEQLKQRILEAQKRCHEKIQGVFFLTGSDSFPFSDPHPEIACRCVTGRALLLIQALSSINWPTTQPHLNFITCGAYSCDGENEMLNPFQAPIWGLAKTVFIEYPEFMCRIFDLESYAPNQMSRLWREVRSDENERQVIIREDVSFVPRLKEIAYQLRPEKPLISLSPDSTYWVTGGTGAIGRSVVQMLIDAGARHIVLAGRNSSQGRDLFLDHKVKEKKVNLMILSCDVSDYEQVRIALEQINQAMPPLRGIMHLAAVVEDGTLNRQNREALFRVMKPKVDGSWNLHLLTQNIPLDFFILFSSLGSITGSPGQGSYGAANAFMDSLAHFRRSQGLAATSINWGAWDGDGLASDNQVKKHLAAWGIVLFSHSTGIRMLERIMYENPVQICAASLDLPLFTNRLRHSGTFLIYSELEETKKKSTSSSHESLESVGNPIGKTNSQLERLSLLRTYVRQLIANSLRMDLDNMDDDENLIKIGLDSLIFLNVAQEISRELGITLVPNEVFANLTINGISENILSKTEKKWEKRDDGCDVTDMIVLLEPEKRNIPFEMLDLQRAYWIGRSESIEFGSVGCHVYFEIDAENLDLSRYESAWQKTIIAHDMLRAVILSDGRQQIMAEVPAYTIKKLDLLNYIENTKEKELLEIRNAMSHKVYPADQWPLFEIRATLLKKDVTRLHISMDLLIADAYSIALLMKYVMDFYKDPTAKPTMPPLSFRDYVRAEKKFRTTEAYERSRRYWHDRLALLPSAPDLPLAQIGSTRSKTRFVRREFRLPAEKWKWFERIARKFELTSANALLAIFAQVLSRWSRNKEFTLNITLFNRLPIHPDVNQIIGDFTSTILFGVETYVNEPFANFAQRIQHGLWEDMDHRHYSGVRVLNALQKKNKNSSRVLMPVIFTSNLGYDKIDNGNALIATPGKIVYNITQTPQVWIDNQISLINDDLVIFWDSVEDLFLPGLLDEMFSAYGEIIDELALDEAAWETRRFRMISKKTLDKREQINATDGPVSTRLLHDLFADQAAAKQDATAVITSSRILSYGELDNRARQIGLLLSDMGVPLSSNVAVVMEKGWEQVVAVIGILNAGSAFVPIDPKSPKERLHNLLQDAQIQFILTQSKLEKQIGWPDGVQILSVDLQDSVSDFMAPSKPLQTPDDPAYVIYTSGSTGFPKGVIINHRGAVNTILDIISRNEIVSKDRVFALSNLNFDLSVFDIFGTLAAGAELVIPDPSKTKDPGHWLSLISQYGVTVWNSVPMLMKMFLESLAREEDELPESLRLVLLSGDWIPLDMPDQIRKKFKNARIISLGGATEASIWSVFHEVDSVDPQMKSIPYGRPLANQRLHVLDPSLNPCPDWVPGDLYIAGIGLANGYLNDLEKTSQAFIIHPETRERLYKTGDIARYFPDGIIEFLGREDFQVKINGYRVEIGEVEAVIKLHQGVDQALVAVQTDEREEKFLVGYFTAKDQPPVSVEDLTGFIKEKLVREMIPVALIPMDSFPLTANGKIDRNGLPAYTKKEVTSCMKETLPGTTIERKIAETVKQVLDIGRVDVNEKFINMGATSLDIVRIHNNFEEPIRKMTSVTDLFEYTTIRDLANYLEHKKDSRHEKENTLNRAKIRRLAGARRNIRRHPEVVR